MAIQTSLRWNLVILSSLFILLTSALVLSNGLDEASIFLALRVSSLTTALPFFLTFSMRPLQRFRVTRETGQWVQQQHRELWVITAVSHLIHLAQIALYYSLGQSCPLLVWAVTLPLWITIVGFAVIAIIYPQWFTNSRPQNLRLYEIGIWYS